MTEVVYPDDADLAERCVWAKMHGLDPMVIPLDDPIEIDYGRRRIVHNRFVWHAVTGEPLVRDGAAVVERVVVQLESPPRPFPVRESLS